MEFNSLFPFVTADDWLWGLGYDWVTRNIYVVSGGGFILACNGEVGGRFSCATVLSGQGHLHGIAVNPIQRYIFLSILTLRSVSF